MRQLGLLSLMAALGAGAAVAADQPAKSKHPEKTEMFREPSKESREKMAELHQRMADCLKSDKPFADCRKEMMEKCHTMDGACGHMHHGKMPGHKGTDEDDEDK